MSDGNFEISADFQSAVQSFERLAKSTNEQNRKLDDLVKVVRKYNDAQDQMEEGLKSIALVAKTTGIDLSKIITPSVVTQATKYADALGKIHTEIVKINRTPLKLSEFSGVDAVSFEGNKRSKSSGSANQLLNDLLFQLSFSGSKRVTGSEALVQLRTQMFRNAKSQLSAEDYFDLVNLQRLGNRATRADRNRGIAGAAEFGEGLNFQGNAELQGAMRARVRLEALFNKASAGRGWIEPRIDVRPTPNMQELTKLHSAALTENTNIDAVESGRRLGLPGLMQSARYFAVYRGLSLIKDTLEDAAKGAIDLSKGIAQIQTITQGSTKTFGEFRSELLQISNIFGLKVEDVATATYLALSNQVVDAAHSFQFMAESAKFAKVTQSSLNDAVNLGSSVLNSYGMTAEQANTVFAKFFKVIEIGRVRAEEVANTIGTVTTLAAPLGVTFEEVGAALATLTTSGVTAANAMTFLRNLLIKIAKPTKDMEEYLTELGFSTGQAAVQTLGFAGFLDKLFEKTKGSTEVTGELVSNIRAIQAVMGLGAKGAVNFADTLEKTRGSVEAYTNTIGKIVQENAGEKLSRQANEVRNSLITTASKALEGLNDLAPSVNLIQVLVTALTVALGALIIKMVVVGTTALLTAERMNVLGVSIANFGKLNGVILVLSLIATALSIASQRAQEFNDRAAKGASDDLTRYTNILNAQMKPALEAIDKAFQKAGLAAAEEYKIVAKALEAQREKVEELKDATIRGYEEEVAAARDQITKLTALRNANNEDAKRSLEKQGLEREKIQREAFEQEISGLSDVEKARRLRTQSEIDQRKANRFASAGDIDRARKLSEQAIKDAEEAKKLDPHETALGGIGLNIALRKRERTQRELDRLNRYINATSGDKRDELDKRKGALLTALEEQDTEIAKLRNQPRMPGRADSDEMRIEKAKQTRIDIESKYQIALRHTNYALDEQISKWGELIEKEKTFRDQLGDILGLIKKMDPKGLIGLESLFNSTTGQIHEKVGALLEGFRQEQAIREKEEKLKSGELGRQSAKEAAQKAIAERETDLTKTRSGDVEALKALGQAGLGSQGLPGFKSFLDNASTAGRGVSASTVEDFRALIAKARKYAEYGDDPAFAKEKAAIKLTPYERTLIGRIYGVGRVEGTGFGSSLNSDELEALKKARDALMLGPKTKTFNPLDPLGLGSFWGGLGDTKAGGGFSVGGGIHHPGEYIVKKTATDKYRTLLDMINHGSTESYLKDFGSRGYFDTASILSPFLANGIYSVGGGVPIFGNHTGFNVNHDYTNPFGTGGLFSALNGPGDISQRLLILGLRQRLSQESGGYNFSGFGNVGFNLGPRLYPGIAPSMPKAGGANTYQFGDITIRIEGGADGKGIAEQIRREVSRSLSTLS